MLKTLFAAAVSAVVAAGAFAAPAVAQEAGGGFTPPAASLQSQDTVDSHADRVDEATGRNRRNRNSQPPPPTPAELAASAQALVTSAGVTCEVTEAVLRGQTDQRQLTYEAACATGPGYILIASTPPQAVDCVLLAGQADIERARDPEADVGTQCQIAQNTDVVRVIRTYAAEAGLTCTVDQGASIGKSQNDNLIYEVGCQGLDGAWLEREATGWKVTECVQVVTQNGTCRFSTAAEQAATLKARFASNAEAAACDVTQARYMGANANGSFFEAKCGAGNGIIARFNTAFEVQQVYPCETAQRIGGGCTLTVVPAAPEATTQP